MSEENKLTVIDLPKHIKLAEASKPIPIRFPKSLHSDFYVICSKVGTSITQLTIGLVMEFVEKNKHLLVKK